MHLIVYVSETTLKPSDVERELEQITSAARARNVQHEITGVLLFENRFFIQAIEGREADLRHVYGLIEQDPRHRNISKLVDEPIRARAFPDWSLDTFYVDSPELITQETIAAIRGIYGSSFVMDAKQMINFMKKMIDEIDVFKILNSSAEPG